MSILATITVMKCDRCEKIETFRSEDQYQTYERQWHSDIINDFCPDCRISTPLQTVNLTNESALSDKELEKIF